MSGYSHGYNPNQEGGLLLPSLFKQIGGKRRLGYSNGRNSNQKGGLLPLLPLLAAGAGGLLSQIGLEGKQQQQRGGNTATGYGNGYNANQEGGGKRRNQRGGFHSLLLKQIGLGKRIKRKRLLPQRGGVSTRRMMALTTLSNSISPQRGEKKCCFQLIQVFPRPETTHVLIAVAG